MDAVNNPVIPLNKFTYRTFIGFGNDAAEFRKLLQYLCSCDQFINSDWTVLLAALADRLLNLSEVVGKLAR